MDHVSWTIAGLIAVVLFLLFWSNKTVLEYQRALKYKNGRFVGVLGPGRHWFLKHSTMLRIVDFRPAFAVIPGQEVLSSDGITLKVSLAAKYEVTDVPKAVNEVENYVQALYVTLQIALRALIGSATVDELLEKRDDLGKRLTELASADVEELGLKLLSLDIKDIMLPGEVKRLFNQVVKARKEGQAALEKARGETAALRNLANAAKVLEDNPALMQLRVLQQFGDTTGNTLVMGMPDGNRVAPLSGGKRTKPAAMPEE